MKLKYLSLILLAVPCFAGTYQISINASSLPANTQGFLDFAFNGGFPGTAVISNFADPGGSLNLASLYTQGTVTGTLPGTVTLSSNNADYDEGITYGTPLSFLLNLTGTPSGNTGNVFTISLFDTTFDGLLTGNTNDGWLVQFNENPQGVISYVAYANPAGGPSFATVTAVPEPATWTLMGLSLGGVFLLRRTAKQ